VYYGKLRQSLGEAEAVLVLNLVIAALLEPYCSRVRIVPWGMDQTRFPWPAPARPRAYRIKDEARDRAREGEAPTEAEYAKVSGDAGSHGGSSSRRQPLDEGLASALGAGLMTPSTEGPQVSRAFDEPGAFGADGPAAPALGAGLMTVS
jgi:hypothetical protein